jgi:hypothetical protein
MSIESTKTESPSPRALVRLAWLNVVLHGLGLVFAAVALGPGSPLAPAAERTAYLAARPWGWSLGWATWMLCALALVAFLAALFPHLDPQRREAAALTVALSAAGAAVDLLCDTLFIVLLPVLARDGPTPLFLAFERTLGAGGAVVANGLYSLSVLLAVACTPRGVEWRWARVLGVGTGVAGLSLVAAGFTGVPWHLVATTPLTIVAFMCWTLVVARAVSSSSRRE